MASRVTEETKNILVEAAWFSPAAVRASSRRHGLHTDASHRFERGADFNAAPVANNLVTGLIVRQCGGTAHRPMTDVVIPELAARTASREPITLRLAEVRRHLGRTLWKPTPSPQRSSRKFSRRAWLHELTATSLTLSTASRSFPPGGSTWSARSTSSKKSPASMATTDSPTPCLRFPEPSASFRTRSEGAPCVKRAACARLR